jgi:hypothetical protein
MSTRQPTHHGYAVNVKDSQLYTGDHAPLSDDEAQRIYDGVAEDFWTLADAVARDHGFRGVWSEGRLGGWAQPYPQPDDDYMDEAELAEWLEHTFRPFEAALLELMADCRATFEADLADAVAAAKREPAERAYWEARDVETVDR